MITMQNFPSLSYDPVTRRLHWITAAIVILQFAAGESWGWFGPVWKTAARNIHTSVGVAFALLLLVRLYWRWTRRAGMPPVHGRLVPGVHALLYGLLIAEVVDGIGWRLTGTHPLYVFGANISCGACRLDRSWHNALTWLHHYGAWVIIVLACGHAGVALWHHLVGRDDTLGRMLPPLRPR
ncbi:cytochrome B561 [Gluconacetobacter azotocaptans DSM 13594]|nr:cytochrome B561 [Gluconacetobacter azotocaptans DSM 13594]